MNFKIGDRIFVRGYIDEIRKDTVIIRNDGGYFGTIPSEIITGKDTVIIRNIGGYFGTDPSEVITGELPSAQPELRWIPCSERLPEVYKDVLICWDFKGNREVLIGNMYSDGTFHGYDDEYLTPEGRKYRKAVAWMPLPKPYNAETK